MAMIEDKMGGKRIFKKRGSRKQPRGGLEYMRKIHHMHQAKENKTTETRIDVEGVTKHPLEAER
jgi:hypothetical protein